MLLYCLFGSFFRLFDQEMNYKHFLQGLLIQNSDRDITKVKKYSLDVLHNLSSGWIPMLKFVRGKASSSRSSVVLAWLIKRIWESLRLRANAIFYTILFSTFLFWSPLNIISLCLLKPSFSLNLVFLFPSGLL